MPAVTDRSASSARGPHVVVFGAGAFGGWTALELARRGARVTLLDAWGPGNVRSSSGGETRVMRATYGSHSIYTELAARALDLWRAWEARWQRTFFRRTGAIWLLGAEGEPFGEASAATLAARGVAVRELTVAEASRTYPQIDFDGVKQVRLEPDAGYLLARRACEHVVDWFTSEGGVYRCGAAAAPVSLDRRPVRSIALQGGDEVDGDQFVFACGAWLAQLFPDVIGSLVTATRQDVYYFGPPAGDDGFSETRLPVWLDFGTRLTYGIPGNANRGFKIADDTPGPAIDPTFDDRNADGRGVSAARAFVRRRFPGLTDAPLLGSEVCQYESTPDSHFIIDRHPAAPNIWIAGGGSGHGYKMGPAVGQLMGSLILDGAAPDPAFALQRFSNPPAGGWRAKWS
jgi:glycine/D-amino acid oxidase-like deaminating enzyme